MGKIELQNCIDKYLKNLTFIESCSPFTIIAYQKDLEQAFSAPKEFGNKELSSFTAEFTADELMQKAYQAQRSWSKLAAASRNRKTATLKSFFRWLHAEGLVDKNLGDKLKAPKIPIRIPHHISVDEVMSVIQCFEKALVDCQSKVAATEKSVIERDYLLFLLMYGMGLRVSEACNLKWNDLGRSLDHVRILGKGGKERIMIPPRKLQKILVERKARSKSEFVLEESISTSRAYLIIKKWGEKTGLLKPLHPHALRHSFATHMLSDGSDLRVLQEMLGHASLTATQKYTHMGLDELARNLEKHHPLSKKSKLTAI